MWFSVATCCVCVVVVVVVVCLCERAGPVPLQTGLTRTHLREEKGSVVCPDAILASIFGRGRIGRAEETLRFVLISSF